MRAGRLILVLIVMLSSADAWAAFTGVRATPAFIRDIEGFRLRSYYKSVLEPRRVGVDFTYRF